MSELEDVNNVYLGWINSILRKGCTSKEVSNFKSLADGKVVAEICGTLNLPLKSCGEEIFTELHQYFEASKIDCNFDIVDATTGDESTLLDITWTLILQFCVCRGQDVDPDDKCIELGRCLLIEWLQIVCPAVGVLDADKELTEYFLGTDLLIKVVESVFSTNLTLPAGTLSKKIFCTLLLVEEAFGVSKSIIDAKSLAEGTCPEFALVVYLSLLKSFYLGDFSQCHNSTQASEVFHRPSLTHSVIHEQPSQEELEETLSSSSGVGTSCTDKFDDRDKNEVTSNLNALQGIENLAGFNQESGIHSISTSHIDGKNPATFENLSLQLSSNFIHSTEYLDHNFACSTPRVQNNVEKIEEKEPAKMGSEVYHSSNEKSPSESSTLSQTSATIQAKSFEQRDVNPQDSSSQSIVDSAKASEFSFKDVQEMPATFQNEFKSEFVSLNDSRNTTDLQVTVIEQAKAENSSIDTIRLREILDRTELGSFKNESTCGNEASASNKKEIMAQTPVGNSMLHKEVQLQTVESLSEFEGEKHDIFRFQPLEPPISSVSDEYNSFSKVEGSSRKVLSPPQDPLMRLLENIADKGQCLRDALDHSQNQLDSGTHSSHNNSLIFGNEASYASNQVVTELEKRVHDLSESNYSLSLEIKDVTRKLDHEMQKSSRLIKELERLESINRSFREENLKQEEKIIFLEDTLLQKDGQAIKERIELRAQKEAIEKHLKYLPLTENLIDVDEKDATIIGLQHEVEEITFEKQKIERELEHTRELMKQKELRQLKEETEREAEMNKLKHKNSSDVLSVDRITEMSTTICNLENALSTSERRNSELNNKLDNLTTYIPNPAPSTYFYEPLNRSFLPTEPSTHDIDLNLSCPCIFSSRERVVEPSYKMPSPVFVNGYSTPYPSYNSYKLEPLPLVIPPPPLISQPNLSQPINLSNSNITSGGSVAANHINPGPMIHHAPYQSNHRLPVFSGPLIKPTSEVALQTPNLSSAEISSYCQNCKNVLPLNNASVESTPALNQISACGDVFPQKTELNKNKNDQSHDVPSVLHAKSRNSEINETSKSCLSQSSRELIDQILAKYSATGAKVVHEPERHIQNAMLPTNDRSMSSHVVPSEPEKISHPRQSSEDVDAKDSNGVRDINYSSLRQATQSITKQILASESEKDAYGVNAANDKTSAKLKTFEEYLQSKPVSKSNVSSTDLVDATKPNASNLKPFLSRTIATNDVFLHDGNLDLKNKHILSSVQTQQSSALPASFYTDEIYRSPISARMGLNTPNKPKFNALFSNMNSDSGISSTSFDTPNENRVNQVGRDFDPTSVIAEMGQRLRNGLKMADGNFDSIETSANSGISTHNAFSHSHQMPISQTSDGTFKYVPHNRISNIEDEIITRYKKELRLVDSSQDLSETVTKDIHANIMSNLRNRKSGKENSFSSSEQTYSAPPSQQKFHNSEEVQKFKPTENVGNSNARSNFPNDNFGTSSSAVSSPRVPLLETQRGQVSAPSNSNADSVVNYLKSLDEKYGAVNQNNHNVARKKNPEENHANDKTKAKSNFLRSSTPTQQLHNVPNVVMSHPPPPAIDVSHISLAAASANHGSTRPSDYSMYNQHHSVQFYPVRNFQDVSSMTGSSGFTN